MGKTIEYYRTYNEKNREQINANSRLRYAIRTGKAVPVVRQDVAAARRQAFMDALEEADPDVQRELVTMLDAIMALFMQNGMGQYAAEHQAAEFLASCVWKGVNVPRKQMRQLTLMQMAAGD